MNTTDIEIKRILKKWMSKQPAPPADGKARLIAEASKSAAKTGTTSTLHMPDRPIEIFSWITVYSLERGVTALRLVS